MKRDVSAAVGGLGTYASYAEAAAASPAETAPVDTHLKVIVGGLATSEEVQKVPGFGQFEDVTPDDPMIATRKVPEHRQPDKRDSRVFYSKRTPKGHDGQQKAVELRLGTKGFRAPG